MFNETVASPAATGFVLAMDQKLFLFTARHVVTGKDNNTGKPLDEKYGCIPNKLKIAVPKANSNGELSYLGDEIDLWEGGDPETESARPTWAEHPTLRAGADIAAVRLPDLKRYEKIALPAGPSGSLNHLEIEGDHEVFQPTYPIFVVGYPFAKMGPQGTAIWTGGTVASEFGSSETPTFLIDSRTREGQSGAPVFRYEREGNIARPGDIVFRGHPAFVLGGLYSGRINSGSDIGVVWKREILVELLQFLVDQE